MKKNVLLLGIAIMTMLLMTSSADAARRFNYENKKLLEETNGRYAKVALIKIDKDVLPAGQSYQEIRTPQIYIQQIPKEHSYGNRNFETAPANPRVHNNAGKAQVIYVQPANMEYFPRKAAIEQNWN